MSRVGFKPTKCSRICSDHFLETDFFQNKLRRLLKQSAVPFGKSLKERRKIIKTPLKKPKKKIVPNIPKSPQPPPTPAELKLQKEVKALKAKVRRRTKKLKSMSDIISQLKNEKLIRNMHAESLKNNFQGTCKDLFVNQVKNAKRKGHTGHRYTDEK